MNLRPLVVSIAVLAAGLVANQGCSVFETNEATREDKVCEPGAFVFCRCADRAEGTKLCKGDGRSFERCTTSDNGECVGGEVPDERTNERVEQKPDPKEPVNALNACPGKSATPLPGVELKLEGDTVTATGDHEGRSGACASGKGANDHVYRILPTGSGKLEIKVTGSDGLAPVAYLRATCDDVESQVSCAPPLAGAIAQLTTNVRSDRQYFLFIDGTSASAGKYVATLKLTTKPFCGDGKIDPGEACDDGDKASDTDGCSNDCLRADGNPATGSSCPGHPVDLWPNQTVTGAGSTSSYGNAWAQPDTTCAVSGANTFADHLYALTPHAAGTLVVSLSAPVGGTLNNHMLSARRTCDDATTQAANMCANQFAGGASGLEKMTFPVTNGQKVFVAVDGGGITSNKGDYVITFKLQ